MKVYSELLELPSMAEYKRVYQVEYCDQHIFTCDGIRVRFYPEAFDHAFYKNANRHRGDKSIFCMERAKRILWIKKALNDTDLTTYHGWDSKKKRYDQNRSVCLVTPDNYVVIISFNKNKKTARFITAYLCDDQKVADKIKSGPIFQPESIDINA